jgi:putative hydrolase of HD superfamily
MSNISDDSAANSILDVLAVAERLKTELRHSWLSNGRRESVAEHTWLMSMQFAGVSTLVRQDLASLARTPLGEA